MFIGQGTTISTGVTFVTHDNSISKVCPEVSDIFGEIHIGDNCFIGQNSTILYGVTICNNVIVAAGSVVTKSIDQEKVIIGGNPAKIIGTWDDFSKKKDIAYCLKTVSKQELIRKHENNSLKLYKRKKMDSFQK